MKKLELISCYKKDTDCKIIPCISTLNLLSNNSKLIIVKKNKFKIVG